MVKLTQITHDVTGVVSIKGIELSSVRHDVILAYLGVDKLCKMDEVHETFAGGGKVVTVVLAQEKPWTYVTHTFVQSK